MPWPGRKGRSNSPITACPASASCSCRGCWPLAAARRSLPSRWTFSPAWTRRTWPPCWNLRAKRLAAFPGCWQGMLDRRLGDALWAAAGLSGRKHRPAGAGGLAQTGPYLQGVALQRPQPLRLEAGPDHRRRLSLEEVERTFQFKGCPGLYFVGETLDCAGSCGGFNLHWAFGSGVVAGRAAATTR